MNYRTLLIPALALAIASSAHAVILAPGVWTDLPGTAGAAGTVMEDALQTFSFLGANGTISGQIQNRVVLKGDGTYFFAWRILNDANSAGVVDGFRLGGFIPSVYDADWSNTGVGDSAPARAKHFDDTMGNVNFDFLNVAGGGGVAAGASSKFFFLDTDATAYGKVAVYDLVGGASISSLDSTFAPVPEPASFAAIGIGLLAFATRRRKSRNA